jgi:glycosidase
MKKFLIPVFLFFTASLLFSQSVPITFHFKPPDNITFTALRIVGTFNGWNNADPTMVMTGPDANGEYTITTSLAANTEHNYKFCMDANWSFAYGDPDNPRINADDNDNSIIAVKEPMIAYLLPRDINTKNVKFIDNTPAGMPIRAVFAYSADKPIDASKITLSIDGVAVNNPGQYFNQTTRELIYAPSPALSTGDHTVKVTITSAAGTDEQTATYRRDPNYVSYKVPVDFYYDQNNKVISFLQTLTSVAVVGAFNNWNETLNLMNDSNGDGLWENTAMMEPGSSEYKFKLNNISWVNDPDNPSFGESADGNNLVVAKVDSLTSMKLMEPLENQTFRNDTTVSIKAALRPGVKSKGVDKATVKIKIDNTEVTPSFDQVNSIVSASMTLTANGRHTAVVSFSNLEGVAASETYTFGMNKEKKGVYVSDGANDENYKYPSSVSDGAADILSVNISETTKHDSLKFTVLMRNIDPRTRLGVLITNQVPNFVEGVKNLGVKLPDWTGEGVFAVIGNPGNAYENTAVENRFLMSPSTGVYDKKPIPVTCNQSAKTFEFTVGIQYLDSLMGSWKLARQFGIVSFLAATDKSGNAYKASVVEGGTTAVEAPNIYDAAFMRSNFWQKRMMTSFIPSGGKNGPRIVSLDGQGRGFRFIKGDEISDSLPHFGADIVFLTPGVTYWYKDVVVHGTVSDTSIHTVTFVFNSVSKDYAITNGKFDIPVTLLEGANTAYVTATDNHGFKTSSKDLVMTYAPDKQPALTLQGSINKRKVTMAAIASSPAGSNFDYMWAPDASNPASIDLSATTQTVTFDIPNVDGEYIIASAISDAAGNIAIARKIIVARGDSVFIPGNNYHAGWIDDAVFYEIYPRSFSQQAGFKGITEKINQIKELGVNAVWLMPVFEGPTVHGYEITDYYSLEKDYGTVDEFKDMLSAFKQAGIKVILDYVVNHTGVTHPFMQNVFQYKDYSPWANFYIWSGQPGNSAYAYYYDWTSLPNLNHNNADVRKYFIDVAKYWIQNFDISGYRCDVAWGVQERNTQFWQDWRTAIKNINPSAFLEAEASSSDPVFYQNRFDSANDWDLRNKIIGVLNNSASLADLHAEATRAYTEYARPFRFMENHDEQRATAMFDYKRSLLTHTLLFTLNGVPLIYSGGEVGETTNRGMINWSDPNNMRPYFKRLIEIKKNYVHNPVIDLIANGSSANVYSYSSISGTNTLVTAANFREAAAPACVLDLSKLQFSGTKDYYLTDLFSGAVIKVPAASRNSVVIPLSGYQARVFYYGPDSVKVISAVNDDLAETIIPKSNMLYQNYPNPFNPTSVIKYQTVKPGLVTIKVYDILGRAVKTLVDEYKNPGSYECIFNGAGLSSGVYFYQLKAGDFVATKKFTLLK